MFRDGSTRGQSIALDYALSLAMGFLLITGLIVGASDYFTDQRDTAQRSELNVIGQQVAAEIAAADRLAQAADANGAVRIERRVPDDVARSTYTIELIAKENPTLLLKSSRSTVEVRVDILNETHVTGSTVPGGDIVVTRTGSGELQIEKGESHA